jgi:DNA helicase-2/ATP-dependent DNA helicase PcrA
MPIIAELPVLPAALATKLADLNQRQRQAVTHPDGPLLVIAGPGTGKTQLLAARVAFLLTQPDVRPQEILCLTYTDAAARNMRQRLLGFIGPEAHRVAIHTFHSLGQLIIQENGGVLGRHDLEPATDLETDEVLREVLDGLPAGHQLRRDVGDAYYDLRHLKQLFQTMKREGWAPAELLQALEEYRLELPYDAAYLYKNPPPAMRAQGVRPGDVIPHKLAEEEAHIERSVAAVCLFEAYQAGLAARRRFDYGDMLAWATHLLEENEGLRLSYQERFQHFLVDEYQDTNGAQSRLLYLLADYWSNPSLLVVGDDDQSIFRFQGASVANVFEFTRRYPQAGTVVLEENYRSSAPVLATAEALISRNQERLVGQLPGLSKQLLACHARFAASPDLPRLCRYATPLHEAADVAAQLAALHHSGQWPTGRVGVITRNHDQMDQLASLLRAAGVPFQRRRAVDVLAEPLAAALHRVLRYAAASLRPDDQLAADAALFELLHLAALVVPPADLLRLALGHQHHRQQAHAASQPVLAWRAWAGATLDDFGPTPPEQPALSIEGRLALARALTLVDGWVQAAATLPLPALLEHIVLETLLPAQLAQAAQPGQVLAEASALLHWGRAEARRQAAVGVSDLLHTWEVLAATREGLPLEHGGEASAALELLTAHSAKGLEWEHVWVLGCQQTAWRRKAADRGFRLPPVLAPATGGDADCEEARRLFFVALTRAQVQLTVCWAAYDEAGKELMPCEFVAELEQDGLVVADMLVSPAVLDTARRTQLAPPPPPAPVPDPALLDELLLDFRLSATVLNSYLACPLACYYEQILRVPTAHNEKLLFGSAMHLALEEFFRQAQQPAAAFGPVDDLVELFRQHFSRARFELPGQVFQRLAHAGPELLRAWWAQAQASTRPTAVVEYRVRTELPGGPRLVGMLDRLDLHDDGRTCDVLDYKTGSPATASEKLRPALSGAATATLAEWKANPALRGGDYWRQGVFYRLLLAHDPDYRYEVASVSFDYLRPVREAGKPPRFVRRKIGASPADEATVLAQIRAVDAAIRRHEFGSGCGECSWCRLRAGQANRTID